MDEERTTRSFNLTKLPSESDVCCYNFTNKGFDSEPETTSTPAEVKEDGTADNSAERPGASTLTRKTKLFVFLSHFLSAWGDRMWSFGVGLFLIQLSPDSLRLTASFGFSSGGAILLLGAVIGDWVDNTPRLKAARVSLISQNLLVCACAVAVFFVFYYESSIISIWPNEGLMKLSQAMIIVTAIMSNLASIAFKIAVERDWIVEICGRDKNSLASMSATLRGIDLTTQILAPVVTGQIMAFTEVYFSAVFIAGWNLVSVVIEYNLIRKVYEQVPALKNKMFKKRKDKEAVQPKHTTERQESNEGSPESEGNKIYQLQDDSVASEDKDNSACTVCCMRVFDRFITVFTGWRTYMKHEVAFAGIGLSCLYMTVLGFDNITVGYAYSQGISEAILGGLQAAGALMGIIGTFSYPRIRKVVGLERTGLFGLAGEIFCLCFCVASIWLPGSPFDMWSSAEDVDIHRNCSNASISTVMDNVITTRNFSITVQNYDNSTKVGCSLTNSDVTPTTSIWFLMIGIITARFGLWVTDLTITQLFLQSVEETERGIVNGVQNSLNKFMDMLKFLLVIVLPKPNQFGLLILISFLFILFGWAFYAKYSYDTRGHLLPRFVKLRQYLDAKNNNLPSSSVYIENKHHQATEREVYIAHL